ncbi:MAG: signal peptidase I [Deltaproteobacteria bacterium]|nr:signal peptidase I [Deltaproteobacteria bacterium]
MSKRAALSFGGWFVVALGTFVLAIALRAFVVSSYKIPSDSMSPTLYSGDYVLVNKFIYGIFRFRRATPLWRLRKPERGDVVVFKHVLGDDFSYGDVEGGRHGGSPRRFIKRIVAVPGDILEIKGNSVYVNRKHLAKVSATLGLVKGAKVKVLKLKPQEYYVMGDNRENSLDSRYFGLVEEGEIEGLAVAIYWSWKSARLPFEIRWERVGKRIE